MKSRCLRALPKLIFCFAVLVARPGSADPAQSRIYRCESNGQVAFSDRPCADAAAGSEVQLAAINTYHESRPTTPARVAAPSRAPSRPQRSDSLAHEQLRHKQQCQRLADQLAAIQSKMRAGYKVREGERLRARQLLLEQRRHTERC